MSFAYFVALACISVVVGDQILTISQGQLKGTILRSRDNRAFYAFYGIPYAAPPVGKLRFSAPRKPPSWEGVRDASEKAPICLQPSTFTSANVSFIGQEDCLYLSVFTPELKPEKPLPVLVYIHGGAFRVGSGDGSGAHFFMDKPIVLVTMNYRHGIFGFLSAANSDIPGNYGLKDQTAALKWVQSNIANFGGDPKTVTILGQSSGATSIHLHTMSPLSKGLFHRVIMQSGSSLAFWSHYDTRHTKRAFADVVKHVNCQANTTLQTLSCLRNMTAEELIRAEHFFVTQKQIVMKFRPAIENPKLKSSFLTTSPNKLRYKNTSIPWIIGFNSAEGLLNTIMLLKHAAHSKKQITRELRRILPYLLHYKYSTKKEQQLNATAELLHFYFKNRTISSETDQQQICNLFSDFVFGMPILHAAYSYSGPKYFYYFDVKKDLSSMYSHFNMTKSNDVEGSPHSHEMKYIFLSEFRGILEDVADVVHSRKMVAYWTNFVINGTPNSQNDQLPRWDLFQPDTGDYLYIADDQITMRKQLLSERYEFWKNLTASLSHRHHQ